MGSGKILVVGLGEIGYSNAEYMTRIGIHADGFDLINKAVEKSLRSGVIKAEAEDFSGYDCYLICISTHDPSDMFKPHLKGLYSVAERIADEGKKGALIAIESTIPLGSSRRVLEIVKHRQHVAHVPHRYYALEKEKHGVKQLRVLGGCEGCCSSEALRFYRETLMIPVYPLEAIEYAELCKIIENTERFLRISFAEELSIVCNGYGLDFRELRDAVNTKWNAEILEARSGIGGHCLPKDSQMYVDLAQRIIPESVVAAAKKSDGYYRRFLSEVEPSRREEEQRVVKRKDAPLKEAE